MPKWAPSPEIDPEEEKRRDDEIEAELEQSTHFISMKLSESFESRASLTQSSIASSLASDSSHMSSHEDKMNYMFNVLNVNPKSEMLLRPDMYMDFVLK